MAAEPLPPVVARRLAGLGDAPEGLLAHRIGQHGQIAVARGGRDIFMAFCPLDVPLSNDALTAIMARFDPAEPLVLRGRYMQAMLACHVLVPDPARAYVMGAGGGRLALVLRYLLGVPAVAGSETDADVLALSRDYFGLADAPGLQIDHADGRAHLAGQGGAAFDHIYVDCFDARGRIPPALVTAEAIAAARGRLAPGGVLAMNVPVTDPLDATALSALQSAFSRIWRWEEGGSQVYFATNGLTVRPDSDALTRLTDRVPFGFDLAEHVAAMTQVAAPGPGSPAPLTDWALFAPRAIAGLRRNDPCPCGSGRKVKHCHGRA